jgi:hypothetical protein
MGHGRRVRRRSGRSACSSCRLFWLVTLLSITNAQSVVDTSPSVLSLASTSTMSTSTTIQKSALSPIIRSSMSTAHASMPPSNSTTSSKNTSAQPTDSPPELFPGATYTGAQQIHHDGVFNYFLFLGLFGVLTAMFLWWIHKRRKRRKEQMRLSGRDALARDMDGWINTSRWFYGTRRHNQTSTFVRREEGLDEHGEAPPPYQPKSDVTMAHTTTGGSQEAVVDLAIPLRTFSRDAAEPGCPPGYRISIRHTEGSILRPDTVNT